MAAKSKTRNHPFFDPTSRFSLSLPPELGVGESRWAQQMLDWRWQAIQESLDFPAYNEAFDVQYWPHGEAIDWGVDPITNALIEEGRTAVERGAEGPVSTQPQPRALVQAQDTGPSSKMVVVDARVMPDFDQAPDAQVFNGGRLSGSRFFSGHGLPAEQAPDRWSSSSDSGMTNRFQLRLPGSIGTGRLWMAFLVSAPAVLRLDALLQPEARPTDFENIAKRFATAESIRDLLAKAVGLEWAVAEALLQAVGDGKRLDRATETLRRRLTAWWAQCPMVGQRTLDDGSGTEIAIPLKKVGFPFGYPLPPAYSTVVMVLGPQSP